MIFTCESLVQLLYQHGTMIILIIEHYVNIDMMQTKSKKWILVDFTISRNFTNFLMYFHANFRLSKC